MSTLFHLFHNYQPHIFLNVTHTKFPQTSPSKKECLHIAVGVGHQKTAQASNMCTLARYVGYAWAILKSIE